MEKLWENVSLSVGYNTHLFYATQDTDVYKRLPLRSHRAHSCIQTQHEESGKVGIVKERGRTADDRMIKAELHPPHQAGHRATIHPSRLLLMNRAFKNCPPLCPYGKWHIILASAVSCVDVRCHMQCEWGLRTTNEGGTTFHITVLEIIIAILHHLPSKRHVGLHA